MYWLPNRLEGVSEWEEELCGFQEVFHAGDWGRGVGAPIVGEFRRYSIEEEGMCHGSDFWAGEM
jgi:hypothetical protein